MTKRTLPTLCLLILGCFSIPALAAVNTYNGSIYVTNQNPFPITFLLERVNLVTMQSTFTPVTTDAAGNYRIVVNDCVPGLPVWSGPRVFMANGSLSDHYYNWSNNCLSINTNDYVVQPAGPVMDGNQFNAGETCPIQSVGHPVNVTTGNMWLKQMDFALPEVDRNLEIARTYNSTALTSGLFGFGWSSSYDVKLLSISDTSIQLDYGNGQTVFFLNSQYNVTPQPTNPVYITPAAAGPRGQIIKSGTQYNLTWSDGRSSQFSTDGRLLWNKDRNGNQTSFTYNGNNQITGITDPFSRTITITPNANGKVAQISDSMGVIASYEYDLTGILLKTVTYSDGSKYKFEYTTSVVNGQTRTFLTTVKDALDNVIETHLYDNSGRATTSERQGGVEKYTLDYTNINSTTDPYTIVTDALGKVTKYHFDKSKGRNAITKVEGACSCGSGGSEVTQYVYDEQLNVSKTIDGLGHEINYTYDISGNPLSETDPLGIKQYTYNSFGEVLTYRDRVDSQNSDPNVKTITNIYSAAGNLLTMTVRNVLADNSIRNEIMALTYTPIGQLQTIKDALNHTTTLGYDTQGRITQVTDANSKNTNFGYDARARITSVINALNETTNFAYDGKNRPTKITYADANFVTYNYDLAGRRSSIIDARNSTTSYAYDSAYRLTGITDPLNHTTSYGYDLMSNLTSQADALGNTTSYVYDDFNRIKKVVYPSPSPSPSPAATPLEENLTYDTVGNIKTRVDTAGRTTSYDYDDANRLVKITDALSSVIQFGYNSRSQLTSVKDALNPSQEYDFAYDVLGRVLSETRAGSTTNFLYDIAGNRTQRTDYNGRATTYEYDALNRLTKMNYTSPGAPNSALYSFSSYTYDDLSRLSSAANLAGTVSLTYDNRNRLKTETDIYGHVIEYGYDANNNRNLLKLDGTSYATYIYDIANRLTSITNAADSSVIGFGYDNTDRVTSRSYPNGVNTTYEYDGMSRLTRLKDVSATDTLFDRQYAYNTANQISQIVEPSSTRTFGYDNVDRMTSVSNIANGNESYSFDPVGNRTSSQRSNTYSYSGFNRLTATATGTYTFDSNGNTVSKSEGSKRWSYLWDFENQLTLATDKKVRVRYVYDALGRRVGLYGGPKGQTKFTYEGQDVLLDDVDGSQTKYINGPGIDNKLRQTTASAASYFLSDHLGSVNGLTDSTGALTASNSYDSFGNPTNTSFASRYQFTGREYDSFTKLQYNRARWYDPNIGRFISEDPTGFGGGDINFYGYAWNNPNRYFDPLGLWPTGSDTADWLDSNINYARNSYQADSSHWIYNATVNTDADIASLFVDPLRAGSGLGYALYDENATGWQRAGAVANDVFRAAAIAGALSGLGSKVGSLMARFGAPAAEVEACSLPKVHGNSLDSPRPTWGYKLYQDDDTFLKNGITSEPRPQARYRRAYMEDKYMKPVKQFPNRRAAAEWERNENMTNPGPLNRERYIPR